MSAKRSKADSRTDESSEPPRPSGPTGAAGSETVARWAETWSALRNAFAVPPSGPVEPDAETRPIVERLCAEVVRRRLVGPTVLFLEMSRPLNEVAAASMHFFGPIVTALFDAHAYERLARYLENRGSLEWIATRLQALEDERLAGGG